MPARCSSSSTTSTQSVRFAAHSWLASATLIVCGTVSAGSGRSALTVPGAAAALAAPACLRRLLVGVDADLNGSAAQDSGRVLCTTELGLKCVTRKGKGGFQPEGSERESDVFEKRMLLQPKVVLDSAVDVLEQ